MAAQAVIAWKPLGELLVERGLLSVDKLDDALEEQARTGEQLGAILVGRKIVAGAVLTALLAEQAGVVLETQGGFGSGLFSKMAGRARPTAPARSEAPAAEVYDHRIKRGPAAPTHDERAFELSALRAEVELLRIRISQLEAELEAVRKPAPRRAKTKTSR